MDTMPLDARRRSRRSVRSALGGKSRVSSAAIFVGIPALVFLTGCALPAVGPDYRRPDTPAAASYSDASEQQRVVGVRLAREWWSDFGEPELDRYVAEALKENQSLKAALARVEQARALTGEARASYLPLIGATGLVSREQT